MSSEVPVFGLFLASVYHAVGVLAFLVSLSFCQDILHQIRHSSDSLLSLPGQYLRGWRDWWRALPNDFMAMIGVIPSEPTPAHKYGAGYPLEVGIAHTAFAWAGMAIYWSEQNVVWFQGMSAISLSLPVIWCWFYGRGYLMHLKTIWRHKPYRWRLFLLSLVIYIPAATSLRVWSW